MAQNFKLTFRKHYILATWDEWANWGECSVSCGDGKMTRLRPGCHRSNTGKRLRLNDCETHLEESMTGVSNCTAGDCRKI